jgi:hypothetical protein
MGTGVRFACITHGGPRPRGSARVPNQIKALSVESGGLEPCRCSRPARDAAPTIAPTIFCSDRLAADAGPGRRRSQLPQIRPDALEAPDFVGIGAKTGPQDGQRGCRRGGGWCPCAFRLKESLPSAGLMAVTREEPLSVDARSPRPAASPRPSVCTPRPDTSTRATKG